MASAGGKVGVYTLGIFDVQNPSETEQNTMKQAAGTLATSGFNLFLLASMHVHDDGSLYFNDTPIVQNGQLAGQLAPQLPQYIRTMKSGTNATILASFGGGGKFNGNAVGFWDLSCIEKLIAEYPNPADNPFFQNLQCLFSNYPFDGLDIDLESYTGYDSFTGTLVTLIRWLTANDHLATLCPYDDAAFWCQVIKQTESNGQPAVAWVNVQGANESLGSFAAALKAVGIGTDAISGGLQVGAGPLPTAQVTQQFGALAKSGVTSGWLWNLDGIGVASAKAYAEAVAAGLQS